MTDQADTRSLKASITVDAPPEAVWEALATAQVLTRWFPVDARVTPGEGGEIWFSWGATVMEGAARIVEWSPPTRLVTAWGGMRDEYLIDGTHGRTTLTIVTHGFGVGGDWDEMYDSVTTGWAFELRGLKHALEAHPGTPRHVVRAVRRCEPDRERLAADILDHAIAPGSDLRRAKTGDRVTLGLGGEDMPAEVAVANQPRDLALLLPTLNDAYMRVLLEKPCGGSPEPAIDATLWVSTFGLDDARRSSLRSALASTLERLLGGRGQAVEV